MGKNVGIRENRIISRVDRKRQNLGTTTGSCLEHEGSNSGSAERALAQTSLKFSLIPAPRDMQVFAHRTIAHEEAELSLHWYVSGPVPLVQGPLEEVPPADVVDGDRGRQSTLGDSNMKLNLVPQFYTSLTYETLHESGTSTKHVSWMPVIRLIDILHLHAHNLHT